MAQLIEKAADFWRDFSARLTLRHDRAAIDTVAALNGFVAGRAAFITQKTHYGYLKTRMGTSYPKMFEDDAFIASINIANMHIFAASLSDLTVYAVARALDGSGLADAVRRDVALGCYRAGLAGNPGSAGAGFSAAAAEAEFAGRLGDTDWAFGAMRRENFTRSPRALVKWAPIAPELKKYDVEIVENSIKFAWQEVRAQFERRLDGAAIAGEIGAGGGRSR